jgi:hypothetical protein
MINNERNDNYIVCTFSTFKFNENMKLFDVIPVAIKKNGIWTKGKKSLKKLECDEFTLTISQIKSLNLLTQPISTNTLKGIKLLKRL